MSADQIREPRPARPAEIRPPLTGREFQEHVSKAAAAPKRSISRSRLWLPARPHRSQAILTTGKGVLVEGVGAGAAH